MSNFSLATLARLALKNHQELQSLFSSSKVPALQLALQLAGVDAGLEFSCAANNAIRFTLSQGIRSVSVQVAPKAPSLNEAQLIITLCQAPYPAHVAACTGKEFLGSTAAPGFSELVDAAKQHLSQFFKANGPMASESSPGTTSEPPSSQDNPSKPALPEFSPVVVVRENLPNLRFNGNLLARVTTGVRNGRAHVYSVYVTEGGKRIGVKHGLSHWLNEKDIVTAEVLETDAALTKFFGFNAVAKELYTRLNLSHCAEEVVS